MPGVVGGYFQRRKIGSKIKIQKSFGTDYGENRKSTKGEYGDINKIEHSEKEVL
jgi:hypothetical protein